MITTAYANSFFHQSKTFKKAAQTGELNKVVGSPDSKSYEKSRNLTLSTNKTALGFNPSLKLMAQTVTVSGTAMKGPKSGHASV